MIINDVEIEMKLSIKCFVHTFDWLKMVKLQCCIASRKIYCDYKNKYAVVLRTMSTTTSVMKRIPQIQVRRGLNWQVIESVVTYDFSFK